ncbi:MAG TPA: hypothetical protein VI111_04425 [Thermoleophilaceae bacterium]
MRRLGVLVCLLAFALPVANARASFDPPDGTVIQANLPTAVALSYSIDLGTICGVDQSADVSAWLRGPSGQVFQPAGLRGSGYQEQSFGVDMTEFGLYTRWVGVRCDGAASEQRVEQGTFTLGGGDPEGQPTQGANPPGGGPGTAVKPTPRQARACKRARSGLVHARATLRQAKRALARKDSAKRRRAVHKAAKDLKSAQKRKHSRCA